MSFEFVCSKCGKRVKNAGALANHMKVHKKKEPTSPSIMLFFTPATKKIAIEMKPIKKQPRQAIFHGSGKLRRKMKQQRSRGYAFPKSLSSLERRERRGPR